PMGFSKERRPHPGRPTRPSTSEGPMNPEGYVLIAGCGRSGTNWLLDILNQSRQTHCRNEPNQCAGSALAALPRGFAPCPLLDAELERGWDEAIARACRSFGHADHPIDVKKDHYSGAAQRMGLVRIARGKRLRRVLGSVLPSFRRQEWPIP